MTSFKLLVLLPNIILLSPKNEPRSPVPTDFSQRNHQNSIAKSVILKSPI